MNGLIIFVLVLRLLMARRQPGPTPLDITKNSSKFPSKEKPSKRSAHPPGEKPLNCYFMHNGLMVDAFEILGVPGGANRDICYRAYIDLRKTHKKPAVIEDAWTALQQYF
jgi:hypothetical protein